MKNLLNKNVYISFLLSAVIFIGLSLYFYIRRAEYGLGIVNKITGDTALIMIGFVLLLGPLSRIYDRFDGWMRYRKDVGIISALYAIIHGVISLFMLPERFPISYYLSLPASFIFGLASLLLMIVLFGESYQVLKKHMRPITWWHLQNWGVRFAGLLAFFHLIVLKIPSWQNWIMHSETRIVARPYLPPENLGGGLFFLFVILVRLAEFLGSKPAAKIIPFLFFGLIATLLISFVFGLI